MHPACMHVNTCTYIHPPTHINIDPTKLIHSKVHKFMVMAETSTFAILHGRNVRGRNVLAEMSVAETSVAEISYMMQVVTINKRSMRSKAIRFFLKPFDKVWFYFKTKSNFISYLKVCIFRLFECVYYRLKSMVGLLAIF